MANATITWMRDPASGLTPGGDNHFDGDYFKARWSETGVIEADCLLCHLPEYDIKKRNEQLSQAELPLGGHRRRGLRPGHRHRGQQSTARKWPTT